MKNEKRMMKNESGMSRVVCRMSSVAVDYGNRVAATPISDGGGKPPA